jgi:prepilin-type N-terminal cleavage/methylation domain-containing protein
MNMTRRNPGFTLIELLVAAALFTAVSAMAAYWIMIGLRAQEFDRNVREAQVVARDVLNRLVDEMRTATTLPLTSLGTSQVPSGILYPDVYGTVDRGSLFQDPIFMLGVTPEDGHFADNLVIFTRPATATAGGSFDPADLNKYAYVQWMVPPSPADARTPWNRVYRRIKDVGTTSPGHSFDTGHWLVRPAYFPVVRVTYDEDLVVGRLNGPDDILEFRVQHPVYYDPLTGAPGKEVTLTECRAHSHLTYDRNLFNVTVRAITFRRGDNNRMSNPKKSETTLRSQVRIQSGV